MLMFSEERCSATENTTTTSRWDAGLEGKTELRSVLRNAPAPLGPESSPCTARCRKAFSLSVERPAFLRFGRQPAAS